MNRSRRKLTSGEREREREKEKEKKGERESEKERDKQRGKVTREIRERDERKIYRYHFTGREMSGCKMV